MHHLTGIPDFAIPDVIAAVVAERWAIDVADVRSLGGGHSSSSWVVTTASGGRLVAKLAEASAKFECGLLVAESLAGCGLRTGRPLRAVDGRICIRFDNVALAVLEFESGEPARAHVPAEARLLGRTLGAVHRSQCKTPPLSGLAAWPPRGLLETPEIGSVLQVLARTVLDDASHPPTVSPSEYFTATQRRMSCRSTTAVAPQLWSGGPFRRVPCCSVWQLCMLGAIRPRRRRLPCSLGTPRSDRRWPTKCPPGPRSSAEPRSGVRRVANRAAADRVRGSRINCPGPDRRGRRMKLPATSPRGASGWSSASTGQRRPHV
jgi:hypothetical protein